MTLLQGTILSLTVFFNQTRIGYSLFHYWYNIYVYIYDVRSIIRDVSDVCIYVTGRISYQIKKKKRQVGNNADSYKKYTLQCFVFICWFCIISSRICTLTACQTVQMEYDGSLLRVQSDCEARVFVPVQKKSTYCLFFKKIWATIAVFFK